MFCKKISANDASFDIGNNELVAENAVAEGDLLLDMSIAHDDCAIGGLKAVVGWAGDALGDGRRCYCEGSTSVNEQFLPSLRIANEYEIGCPILRDGSVPIRRPARKFPACG